MSNAAKANLTNPTVSVAMITYNHGPYVEQAIKSILDQQTDFGVELIIGEDCSKDGTPDIVRRAQSQFPDRVRVIASETNVGMHANLRRVELACRGEYIAYCEGDDFWNDRTKLAKQIAFLSARPGYSMVHSHCHRFLVKEQRFLSNSLTVPKGLDDTKAYEDILTGRRGPLTVTVLARRAAVHRIVEQCPECTDPKWPMGDTQRWLELARLGSVGCIHEPLATTNVLPESAGQSLDLRKRLRFYMAARELHLHYLQKYPVAAAVERQVREKLALILLQHACNANDPEAARQMYDAYVEQGGRSRLRARWLLWGSHSHFNRTMVGPLIKFENLWRRSIARLGLAAPNNRKLKTAAAPVTEAAQ